MAAPVAGTVIDGHPAADAWRRLGGSPPPIAVKHLKKSKPKKSLVYRLIVLAPHGTAVIAKRCRLQSALKEEALYTRVLPQLGLPSLRFYGAVDDTDVAYRWVFVEDAGDCEVAETDWPHIARWLACFQSQTQESDPIFPDHGVSYYASHLATVRRGLRALDPAFGVGDETRAVVSALRRAFDIVSDRWSAVAEMWDATPKTLVHGDFVSKNLRVRHDGAGISLFVFDWETAGLSSPGVDLVTCGRPFHGFPDSRVLEPYAEIVRSAWGLTDADLRTLVQLGMIFRCIKRAAMDSSSFSDGPRPWLMQRLQANAQQIDLCLRNVGWS